MRAPAARRKSIPRIELESVVHLADLDLDVVETVIADREAIDAS